MHLGQDPRERDATAPESREPPRRTPVERLGRRVRQQWCRRFQSKLCASFAVSGFHDVQNPAAEATARDGATPRVNPRYNHGSHHSSAPRASPQDNSKCYFRTDGCAAQCHGQTPVTLSQMALDWRSQLACSRNFPSWERFARTARSRSRLGHLPFLTPSFRIVPYFCVSSRVARALAVF